MYVVYILRISYAIVVLANKLYTLSCYGILIYIYLCNHCPSPLNCLVIADVQVYSIQPYMIKSLQRLMAESFNGVRHQYN